MADITMQQFQEAFSEFSACIGVVVGLFYSLIMLCRLILVYAGMGRIVLSPFMAIKHLDSAQHLLCRVFVLILCVVHCFSRRFGCRRAVFKV